eukprot:m.56258 g.56258  ORF g.56258 m.56258 type:complete len:369 (-) comp12022_c0_seq4:3079-4185(-)
MARQSHTDQNKHNQALEMSGTKRSEWRLEMTQNTLESPQASTSFSDGIKEVIKRQLTVNNAPSTEAGAAGGAGSLAGTAAAAAGAGAAAAAAEAGAGVAGMLGATMTNSSDEPLPLPLSSLRFPSTALAAAEALAAAAAVVAAAASRASTLATAASAAACDTALPLGVVNPSRSSDESGPAASGAATMGAGAGAALVAAGVAAVTDTDGTAGAGVGAGAVLTVDRGEGTRAPRAAAGPGVADAAGPGTTRLDSAGAEALLALPAGPEKLDVRGAEGVAVTPPAAAREEESAGAPGGRPMDSSRPGRPLEPRGMADEGVAAIGPDGTMGEAEGRELRTLEAPAEPGRGLALAMYMPTVRVPRKPTRGKV